MKAIVIGAALLGLGGSARADRLAQAHAVFADSCARCHTADKLRVKAAAMKPADKNGAVDRLRAWLERPAAINPDTRCQAARLDGVQRDAVIGLLRRSADPMKRSTAPPTVPRLAHAGFAPKPARVGPTLGQGDHR